MIAGDENMPRFDVDDATFVRVFCEGDDGEVSFSTLTGGGGWFCHEIQFGDWDGLVRFVAEQRARGGSEQVTDHLQRTIATARQVAYFAYKQGVSDAAAVDALISEVERLRADVERKDEALRFYADHSYRNWLADEGKRARAVLSESTTEEGE